MQDFHKPSRIERKTKMKPANFPRNKQRKQQEAAERNEKWKTLSVSDKLASLKFRGAENSKQYKKLVSMK